MIQSIESKVKQVDQVQERIEEPLFEKKYSTVDTLENRSNFTIVNKKYYM